MQDQNIKFHRKPSSGNALKHLGERTDGRTWKVGDYANAPTHCPTFVIFYTSPRAYFQNRSEVSCSKGEEPRVALTKHKAMLKGRFTLYLLEECTYSFTTVHIKKKDTVTNCEVREKTNKMQQLDVYYQHFFNMFRASLCPSSGEQDVCYCTWCAALVLLDVRTVTFTVLASYNAAPHNRYQPHPAEPAQHTTCSNTRLGLLKMGIMMPETCWESVDNKHLTVASCWFSLSLHNLLTMHGHRNLKLTMYPFVKKKKITFPYIRHGAVAQAQCPAMSSKRNEFALWRFVLYFKPWHLKYQWRRTTERVLCTTFPINTTPFHPPI